MKLSLTVFTISTVVVAAAGAQTLSPQAVFHRCYAQLTGSPVPLNHALRNKVISGEISAVEACKTILKKAQLNNQGRLANPADKEARSVLNTFYDFHRTWFAANNFDTTPGYTTATHISNSNVYDATEPALSVTYSMFGLQQKYADTLTRSTGVTALRQRDTAKQTRLNFKSLHPARYISDNSAWDSALTTFRDTTPTTTPVSTNINVHKSIRLQMPRIQVGELIGITPTTQSFTVPNISLQTGSFATDKGSLYPDLNYSYNFYQNHGGGVLGSPIYLMQYYGHPMNTKFNGADKVARRWSQQNMETFLCAQLPALREQDIRSMVDTKSTLAFRQSASCVMCHATLDPMAYTARGFTVGSFDAIRPRDDGPVTVLPDGTRVSPPPAYIHHASAITTYKATKASVPGWPSARVTDFHLQKPTGRLYFRSLTGELIDRSVNDIAHLGQAMANTEDFYLCAAKRYFEYMTGIAVPLYDRTNPANADLNRSLSAEAVADRAFVESLARNLKSHGSLVRLVEEILGSTYYSLENFR